MFLPKAAAQQSGGILDDLERVRTASMQKGSTKYPANFNAIWEVKIKINQNEILRWQYMSTSTINIHVYMIKIYFAPSH